MPVEVQGPDGNTYHFPDGTDKNAAIGYFRKKGIGLKADVGPKPEARTVGNYLSEAASGVGRGIVNDATGIAQTLITNPVTTVKNLAGQITDADAAQAKEWQATAGQPIGRRIGASALAGLEKAPVIGGMVQHAEEGGERMASPESVGAAAEGITTFAAPEAIGKGVGRFIRKVPGAARSAAGAGPRVTADLLKETAADNAASVAKADAENAASQAKAGEAREVETKRTNLQNEIREKSRELQARIETAREAALKEGNEKYDTVNAALSDFPADMDKVQDAYLTATQSFGETQSIPPMLKRMEKSMSEPMTYSDEQKLYSDLGKELSKGSLPGTTYHAYDVMHEAIGEDMQRVADSQGHGAALTEARNYWRRMKQTFGKPYVARDAASKTLSSLSPEFAREEARGNATRMLGNFDPDIPRVAGEVTESRKGLKSLPKAKPTQAPPPVVAAEKKIGPADIQERKAETVAKRAERIRNSGSGLANTFAVMSAIRSAINLDVAGIGEDVAVRAAYGAGKAGLAKLLESKPVVEWLSKATPEDLAQVPPGMRANLGSVVQAAKKRGLPVSPAFTSAALAGQAKGVANALSIGTSQGNPGTPP